MTGEWEHLPCSRQSAKPSVPTAPPSRGRDWEHLFGQQERAVRQMEGDQMSLSWIHE